MDEPVDLLRRRLDRERRARKAAEAITEEKSRELYGKNLELEDAVAKERRARGEAEALREALVAFTAELDLDQIVRQLEGFLARLVPHRSRAVYVRFDDELVLCGISGRADPREDGAAPEGALATPPDCFGDIEQATSPLILRPAPAGAGMDTDVRAAALPIEGPTWMAAALTAHGRHLGFVLLGSDADDAFDDAGARLAQALANEAAAALENVRLFREVERLSTTDPLTGLHNRRHFDACASAELERASRHGLRISAIMLDLDHFKDVNDIHGHAVGDLVLAEVARVCLSTLRASDLDARYGGEEFCFFLPETGSEDAAAFAERLRAAIAGLRFATGAGELSVTASLGVAERDSTHETVEALIRRSDEALYVAKRSGRDRVAVR
jgi:diguanylate cyclase (GGDEF)-like protein